MKIKIYLAAAVLFVSVSTFSQELPKEKSKKITISEFHLQNGFLMNSMIRGSLNDFNTLAPSSSLLKNDFSDYNESYEMGRMTNTYHAFYLGLRFNNQEKNNFLDNPVLRLGFNYASSNSLSAHYSQEIRTPYDTLISSQTGQSFYVDSVHLKNYHMGQKMDQLRIDAALIFQTNQDLRFSFFAGIGISAGMSLKSEIEINYDESNTIESLGEINSESYDSNDDYSSKREIYTTKNIAGATAYVPFGINLRLGKKREFWKHVNLYMESRAALNITSIPELKTYTTVGLSNSLGLKITW